uniref:Tudor domain containing 7 n=1 Tax=Esox lucius TaxID=8010 RepID=A0AAY5KNL7_ESOLU
MPNLFSCNYYSFFLFNCSVCVGLFRSGVKMSDDQMKKMLRAVLQSNKNGVSISRLQGDYRSLTGEYIPYKQLGYPSLETLLHSIPSVVRMENRMGEVMCHAAVCQETAHIAQLVARQKSNKKVPGRSRMLNCQMRPKQSSSFMLYCRVSDLFVLFPIIASFVRGYIRWPAPARSRGNKTYGGFSASGDVRKMYNQHVDRMMLLLDDNLPIHMAFIFWGRLLENCLEEHPLLKNKCWFNTSLVPAAPKPSALQTSVYNPKVVQSLLTEVLKKFTSGLWLSKLPEVYRAMHNQDLPGQAVIDLVNWTHICCVTPNSASPPSTSQNSFSASSLLTPTSPTPPPIASPRQPSSPAVDVPADVRVKLRELLSKYNQGLWAHALPKLYQETFKVPFPEDILANLCLLFDVCTVEYPMPDKKKAILYGPAAEHKAEVALSVPLQKWNWFIQEASSTPASPLGCKFSSSSDVPPLVLPKVEFPSVLVVEASSTTQVVLRYIGEDYSQAQQAMEESMRTLYSQPGAQRPLSFPRPGTLAAVKVEGGEEVVRAQVSEVMKDTVKVYYVDHGFSEVISKTQLMELQKDFFKLPFQASLCTLAGLGPFSSERSVLSTLESLAVGRILLAELLEQDVATPRVLLYDTSLSEDVNINAACLKALQDTTMENPLQVNSTYMNVSVTNVCSDGTIYCQLPSRGRVKLNEILEKVEAFFITQVTSDSLVSLPFCGMCCLARHKGKWSRVEITNLHGSRVLDIRFVDLGVPASVEVTELREIPPPFLRELAVIPPQAIKCCLVDLPPEMWTPEAVLWLRDAVLHSEDCMMTISKLDEAKLVHIYLFSSNGSQNDTNSINRQMATSGLWKRPAPAPQKDPSPRFLETTLSSVVDQVTLHSSDRSMGSGDMSSALSQALHTSVRLGMQLALPSPMELPQAGQNMDVFVSVACHPGHFVLQPWQDLYKLVVLMGEMILYYNQREERLVSLELRKGEVYAAKVDNNWHRVLVKAILSNGLVSVYELDYGKHELVGSRELEPLIESFRQLPFQAVRAQLAGVQQRVWSEAASIVFRNHVEKKPLVAQVESVVEAEFPWDRKVVVYLVDTSQKEKDVWIHNIIADFPEELSTAV